MIMISGLSDQCLIILIRLLSDDDDHVTSWILERLIEERQARAAGGHAFPLEVPVLNLEDARILNRHLIVAAHVLEDLGWQPHADNAPNEPFLDGARFLAQVSEDLGKLAVAGSSGKLSN